METQRGRESFSANDLPYGKRVTRKRLPTPFARFQQRISGRVLNLWLPQASARSPVLRSFAAPMDGTL